MKTIRTKEEAWEYLKGKKNQELDDWIELELYDKSNRMTIEKREHIRHCLIDIILDAFDIQYGGDFSRAVLSNSFSDVAILADRTNLQVLDLYARFVLNYLPIAIIKKWIEKKLKNG